MSLVVVRAVGLITVQDLGRPGHMHEGLAPGGALVPELLKVANARAQNRPGTAAIEVMGALTVRAVSTVRVATDTLPAWQMRPGDEVTVESGRHRVTYLAIGGGVDAPEVLGSRSAQPSAGLGTLLRAGHRLGAAEGPADVQAIGRFIDGDVVRVVPGPDLDAFDPGAIELLTSGSWTVSASSDRVGTRLHGRPLPRNHRVDVTRPLVRGAIEVPRDGQPIVLGPEHPTTGGYPVIAVVVHTDLGRFFARAAGETVRFVAEAHQREA
jgi:biotin-dependent carboxylase-like uncharacterized protein